LTPKATGFSEITPNKVITPFKVIQGHPFSYQSKAHKRLPISVQYLSLILHRFKVIANYGNDFENRLIFDEVKAYKNCAIFWATSLSAEKFSTVVFFIMKHNELQLRILVLQRICIEVHHSGISA